MGITDITVIKVRKHIVPGCEENRPKIRKHENGRFWSVLETAVKTKSNKIKKL